MIVYLPTYSDKREVVAIDTEKARIEKWGSEKVAIYKGTIYNADHAYKTIGGAWADWNRDYKTMYEEEIEI